MAATSRTDRPWEYIASYLLDLLDRPGVVLDDRHRILLLNDSMGSLLGRGRAHLMGSSWVDECVPEEQRRAAQWYLGAALRGAVKRCELPVKSADGEAYMLLSEFSIVREGAGVALVAIVESKRRAEAPLLDVPRGDNGQVLEPATTPEDGPRSWYEIDVSRAEFGRIVDSSDPELLGRRCYEVRYGNEAPCEPCPARGVMESELVRVGVVPDSAEHDGYEIIRAERAAEGQVRLRVQRIRDTDLTELLHARVERLAREAGLSARERSVLDYLLMGRSLSDIAMLLGITPRTVKFHQTNVLQKLGADSRVDLMRLFL